MPCGGRANVSGSATAVSERGHPSVSPPRWPWGHPTAHRDCSISLGHRRHHARTHGRPETDVACASKPSPCVSSPGDSARSPWGLGPLATAARASPGDRRPCLGPAPPPCCVTAGTFSPSLRLGPGRWGRQDPLQRRPRLRVDGDVRGPSCRPKCPRRHLRPLPGVVDRSRIRNITGSRTPSVFTRRPVCVRVLWSPGIDGAGQLAKTSRSFRCRSGLDAEPEVYGVAM